MEAARPTTGGRAIWIVLSGAVLAIIAAFAIRAYRNARILRESTASAEAALARDTYGGFRDADRALRDLVGPHSKDINLVALRSYALAQLAARYGDDQAAVDSELLNAPVEREIQEGSLRVPIPPRFSAARALLLLANGEPGSALLMLSDGATTSSPELAVVRAQVFEGLEKPRDAKASLAEALTHLPPSLEALRAAATDAARAHDEGRAAELAERAVKLNPEHWPSLLLLGQLAVRERSGSRARLVDPTQAREWLDRALPDVATEASPAEQCQALFELAEIDLALGNIAGVVQTLDRGAQIDETPPPAAAISRAWTCASAGRSKRWPSWPPPPPMTSPEKPPWPMASSAAIPRS